MVSVSYHSVAFPYSILYALSLSSPDSSSYFPSIYVLLLAASNLRPNILEAKILRSFAVEVIPSRTIVSVSNVSRRGVFSNSQSRSLFGCARLPVATERRTSATGSRIFFPDMAKARLASMDNNIGDSKDTARLNVVKVSPSDLFPTDMRPKVTWISPKVALLVSEKEFRKSAHTLLNLHLDGSSIRIRSWIEKIVWSHNPI